ncbi:MAG: rRNA maturation RNase YbeY [Ignavibacteriae bacterium]|nr:rRNA maturation RNase YbeY [Ignavibacteriota bacterium]
MTKVNLIYEIEFIPEREQKSLLKSKVIEAVKTLHKEEGLNCSIVSFLFCTDERIRKFNREFLSHDYETDILTFYDTDDRGRIESDIIISPDTVKYNSKRFKKSFSEELFRVILHGLLHLCGYDDKSAKNKKIMRQKEDQYLEKIGYLNLNA